MCKHFCWCHSCILFWLNFSSYLSLFCHANTILYCKNSSLCFMNWVCMPLNLSIFTLFIFECTFVWVFKFASLWSRLYTSYTYFCKGGYTHLYTHDSVWFDNQPWQYDNLLLKFLILLRILWCSYKSWMKLSDCKMFPILNIIVASDIVYCSFPDFVSPLSLFVLTPFSWSCNYCQMGHAQFCSHLGHLATIFRVLWK